MLYIYIYMYTHYFLKTTVIIAHVVPKSPRHRCEACAYRPTFLSLTMTQSNFPSPAVKPAITIDHAVKPALSLLLV